MLCYAVSVRKLHHHHHRIYADRLPKAWYWNSLWRHLIRHVYNWAGLAFVLDSAEKLSLS